VTSGVPSEIRTERLLLRRWRPEDVEPLAAIYAQPAFQEFMPPTDLEATGKQIERFEDMWRRGIPSQWAAEELATGELVGRAGLMRHTDWLVPDALEVGWSLDPAHWGRGLATEAGRASVEVWRQYLGGERLHSFTRVYNRRSRAVMERLGMTPRGTTWWRGWIHVWYALDPDG
jgi:RimJ/RimL family protein N-acetyltransferase